MMRKYVSQHNYGNFSLKISQNGVKKLSLRTKVLSVCVITL